MANDHHVRTYKPARLQLRHIMQHVDQHLARYDLLNLTQLRGPLTNIVVAAHGSQRRDRAQRIQHMCAANVARLNDVMCAAPIVQCLWPQQAMSVGDQVNRIIASDCLYCLIQPLSLTP